MPTGIFQTVVNCVTGQASKREMSQSEVTAITSVPVPKKQTLSDWRVGLLLMGRYADVKASVEAARDSGTAEGKIAWERFEYANDVYRHELLSLAPVMGFTAEDVDESLWKARNVSNGELVPGPANRT